MQAWHNLVGMKADPKNLTDEQLAERKAQYARWRESEDAYRARQKERTDEAKRLVAEKGWMPMMEFIHAQQWNGLCVEDGGIWPCRSLRAADVAVRLAKIYREAAQ